MKTVHKLSLLFGWLLLLAAGCADARDEAETDEIREVTIEAVMDFTDTPFLVSARSDTNGYKYRFVIEIYDNNNLDVPVYRQVFVCSQEEMPEDRMMRISITTKLSSRKYKVAVWTDYTHSATGEDCFYDATHLTDIGLKQFSSEDSPCRDAISGRATADLGTLIVGNRLEVPLRMKRVVAPLQIIASDVQEFLEKQGKTNEESIHVGLSYAFYYPVAFDVLAACPVRSQVGVSVEREIALDDIQSEKHVLLTDYILCSESETFTVVSVTVTDSAGKVLGLIKNMKVFYKSGSVTTLEGNFLTTQEGANTSIDIGFGSDIDMDLDNMKK